MRARPPCASLVQEVLTSSAIQAVGAIALGTKRLATQAAVVEELTMLVGDEPAGRGFFF